MQVGFNKYRHNKSSALLCQNFHKHPTSYIRWVLKVLKSLPDSEDYLRGFKEVRKRVMTVRNVLCLKLSNMVKNGQNMVKDDHNTVNNCQKMAKNC